MTTSLIGLLHQSRSPLRKRLLAYFFSNPEACLYLREIALKLGVDAANLSRELSRLVKEGVFMSEKRGLQKYFKLNHDYALYRELKSMIFKTLGVQGALRDLLQGHAGIRYAFLYGSFAKNAERAGSDIDLCLIVQKGEFEEDPLLEKLHKLEKELGREINYVFYTEAEWESKKDSKDSFVLGLLKNKRLELVHEKN
ncbi:MAG: nucleotidyltransferase domain-containing protein [Candidatus Omnitrophica bacterium]|nr:nucleotidyltransferase domain-containing protein [Candidatus Omnitrophota bacterium]